MYFSVGRCCLEFTQALSCVALAWHKAGGSTPLGVTSEEVLLAFVQRRVRIIVRYSRQGVARIAIVSGEAKMMQFILAEGAIALSVTLSGGALFAS